MAAILVADDDPLVRMIASELLAGCGHAVVEADDGLAALRVVNTVPIDLIVLDMLMPNMDGLEVIQSVRAHHPGIRIVAISAGGRGSAEGYLHTAKAFGADEVVVKPLSPTNFPSLIDRVLNAAPQPGGFG